MKITKRFFIVMVILISLAIAAFLPLFGCAIVISPAI